MEIPKELNNEIWEYCRVNDITNIDEFKIKLLKQGFTTEKFGATPVVKTVEKIVEKVVEVPVEKIVEKIVEVPINMVDTELVENYKIVMAEVEQLKRDNKTLVDELAVEKNKNKRDIYGEG
jgi:hypothetical protein